jgi:hypothetical protein
MNRLAPADPRSRRAVTGAVNRDRPRNRGGFGNRQPEPEPVLDAGMEPEARPESERRSCRSPGRHARHRRCIAEKRLCEIGNACDHGRNVHQDGYDTLSRRVARPVVAVSTERCADRSIECAYMATPGKPVDQLPVALPLQYSISENPNDPNAFHSDCDCPRWCSDCGVLE